MAGNRLSQADFTQFMAVNQRPLLRFGAALCGDPRLAEDIVADVLGRAYERWDRISRIERPVAYVRRMVVNEFISRARKASRTQITATLDDYLEPAPDHASEHAEREALKARMSSLPVRQRVVLVLRYYEGYDDVTIASILDCAPGTARSLISRALATLRVHPGDETPSPAVAKACGTATRDVDHDH